MSNQPWLTSGASQGLTIPSYSALIGSTPGGLSLSDFGPANNPSMGQFSPTGPTLATTDFSKFGSMGAPALGGGSGLGFNMGTAQLALGGLNTLGSLWGSFQAMKLAKKQFKFEKNMSEQNMANQMKTYNTTLADRQRNRAAMERKDPSTADAYIAANSLTRDKTL